MGQERERGSELVWKNDGDEREREEIRLSKQANLE